MKHRELIVDDRHTHGDEESWVESGTWDEELAAEADEELHQSLGRRLAAKLGTAYGISVLAHVGVLVILGLIVIAAPPPQAKAVVIAGIEKTLEPYDPEIEKQDQKQPEVPLPPSETEPVVMIEEPVDVSQEPLGEPNNASNKDRADVSLSDLNGLAGGPPAGMRGRLTGLDRFRGDPNGRPPSEDAVDAALRWLKRHQSPDGRWDSDAWQQSCAEGGCQAGDTGHDKGGSHYDVGLTSLALLAYTGHGNSHRFGVFKRTVASALRWLRAQQQADGSLGFHEAGDHGGMYNHALATMALAELYGTSRDFTLRRAAESAVAFCLKAQNPNLGWKYRLKQGKNDTSVTGWMVLALKAAKTAGLEVPPQAFEDANRWFHRATNTRGEAGYEGPSGGSAMLAGNERFSPSPTMTAVSVVCRVFGGERLSTAALRDGSKVIASELPEWSPNKLNYYYWYYGTYALFQFAGPRWDAWSKAMLGALLPNQKSGGCHDGSWEPAGEWCVAGGRVYAVALNALTLEVWYRYKRQSESSNEVAQGPK